MMRIEENQYTDEEYERYNKGLREHKEARERKKIIRKMIDDMKLTNYKCIEMKKFVTICKNKSKYDTFVDKFNEIVFCIDIYDECVNDSFGTVWCDLNKNNRRKYIKIINIQSIA
tara:strand:- start:208 stop:552 length:345 start_codon:yes stop_codon:yes gene_type:complete